MALEKLKQIYDFYNFKFDGVNLIYDCFLWEEDFGEVCLIHFHFLRLKVHNHPFLKNEVFTNFSSTLLSEWLIRKTLNVYFGLTTTVLYMEESKKNFDYTKSIFDETFKRNPAFRFYPQL
jgi:hypothetical protein